MTSNEADFPAKQSKAKQDTRLSHPHAHDRRTECSEATTHPRTTSSRRVKSLSSSRFDTLFKTGRRASGESLRIMALPGQGLLGVAASKALGCHAWRKRQKRRIKAVWPSLLPSKKLDWICLARPSIYSKTHEELVEEMLRLKNEIEDFAKEEGWLE
jgi:ribonuclease P protein component